MNYNVCKGCGRILWDNWCLRCYNNHNKKWLKSTLLKEYNASIPKKVEKE